MRKKATNLEGKGLSIPVTLLISSPKTLLSFINAKIFLAGKNPRFMKAKPQLFELFEGIPAKKIYAFMNISSVLGDLMSRVTGID